MGRLGINGSRSKVVKLGKSLAEQFHGLKFGPVKIQKCHFQTQLTRDYFTGRPFGQPLNAQILRQIPAWLIMLVKRGGGN
jgi:hypothetical protein